MNFFQAQLHYLFGNRPTFKNAKYIGRACYIPFSDGTKIKAEFITRGTHDKYEAVKLSTMNTAEGVIDSICLNFKDYFGGINGSAAGTFTPHIWVCDDSPQWYGSPTYSDKESLADAACEYIGIFQTEQAVNENMAMFM